MTVTEELNLLKAARLSDQEKQEEVFHPADQESTGQIAILTRRLEATEELVQKQKLQIIQLVTDSNKKHNEQQNQLQGVEAVSSIILIRSFIFLVSSLTKYAVNMTNFLK